MPTPSVRLTLTATLLFAVAASSQVPLRRSAPALRADVNLVLVPVTVTDRNGKILNGLDRSLFRIFDEGVPQPIASFSAEDLPVSMGLVLDVSGSVKTELDTARSFIATLLAGMDPRDEALFLTCADRPAVRLDLTADMDRVDTLLRSIQGGGWTALTDSIYLTIDRMKPARHARKVLVVVSDGQDNLSRYTRSELLSRAIESETQIYTIAIHEASANRKAIERLEEIRGMAFLQGLAHATGGLYFQMDSLSSLARAAETISIALHRQYLLGYYAPETSHTGPRRIQVKLDVPDARLYTRNRYYSTVQ